MGLRVPLAGAGQGCAVGKCRAHPGPPQVACLCWTRPGRSLGQADRRGADRGQGPLIPELGCSLWSDPQEWLQGPGAERGARWETALMMGTQVHSQSF